MNTATVRLSGVSKVSLVLTFALWAGAPAGADDNRHQVSPFYGSFSHTIPIEVPPFHGVEPKLALSYSSEGRNGWLGVGWSLAGISTIERVNGGRGTPNFDANDTYLLDGQELVACVAGMVSPSCTTGGSHATKVESYLKIRFDATPNTWTVWSKDGTRTIFSPTFVTASFTFRWGQSGVVDTFGNTVTYNWASSGGDRYPSTVTYNGYSITFYREPRPDAVSFGAAYEMGWTQDRFKSVFVSLGATPIRAYKLSYSTSAVTSRSLLSAVQQFGKDVAHTSGTITGGTSLPAQTFAYQNDTLGRTFQSTSTPPATPPNTQEPVTWARRVNAYAIGPSGSSLKKVYGGSSEYNAGASSTRAITSGDGFMEYTFQTGAWAMAGLSNGDTSPDHADIDFALYSNASSLLYIYENGALMGGGWGVANGDTLRVEVTGGTVKYRKNGALLYTSTKQPTYPLLVDTSIRSMDGIIANVNISGALIDESHWCGGNNFKTADFNGDGRTDQFCYGPAGLTRVRLATASGFAEPTTWQSQSIFNTIYLGDFNGDGKTDLLDFGAPNAAVSLSTGSSFGPKTFWGNADGYRPDNGWHVACYGSPTVADFNGDGKSDVLCGELDTNNVFVGISSGASLSFSIWTLAWCDGPRSAADIDGDGKDDYVCISSSSWLLSTKLSTGSGFLPGNGPYLGGSFCALGDHVLSDLNGDGKTDVACRGNGKVALSTGRILIEQGTYGGWCSGGEVFGADADGDGEGDVVCNNPGAGATDIQVRQWNGSTLAAAETWKASWCNGSVRSGDYNGDGKMDLLCDSLATPVALGGTNDFKSDLVFTLSNGIGGSTQLQYAVSTDFPNTVGSPPAKFVVAGLTVGDGRGNSATTTYTYSGARFDRVERLFLGFEYGKRTLPCIAGETACPYEETYLRQDIASLGKPSWITRRSGSGDIFSASGFEYATNGTTVPRTSVLSNQWTYIYGSGVGGGCTLPCSFAKRVRISHQHDSYGNVEQTTEYGDFDSLGDELTTTWTFVPNQVAYIVNRPATETKTAAGSILAASEFWYDGAAGSAAPVKGAVTTIRDWLDPGNRWVSMDIAYDAAGNVVSSEDPTERVETVTFDPVRSLFPISATNPAGETETATWDFVCGIPLQLTDQNNQLTDVQTDALCRVTQTTGPLGSFELRAYESLGNPNAQRVVVQRPSASPGDGSGHDFSVEYVDGFGRTYRREDKGPLAGTTIVAETGYNARGGVSWRTSPYYSGEAPQTTVFSYDQWDRRVLVTLPDASTLGRTYGVLSMTASDENSRLTTTRFDVSGRKVASERYLGGSPITTTYSYDLLGRMTTKTDPTGNVWSWTFDTLARNTEKSDPDAGTWSFIYDDAGRTTSQTDARGKVVSFTYDLAGRLASKSAGTEGVSFTYGEARTGYFNVGRLTTVTSNIASASTLKTDHDALGRAVKQTRTLDGVDHVVDRRYDAGSRLRGTTFPDGDIVGSVENPIQYDARGRLFAIPGIVSSVLYDASGRVTLQTNANGTVTTRTHDPERGFLTGIQTVLQGATIQSLSYSVDPAGHLLQATSPFADEAWGYGYDDLYRLTTASNTTNPANSQTFAYDALGRITHNSRVGIYAYPAVGQARPNAPQTVAGNSFAYDANGNLLNGAGRTLTWGDHNTLTSVVASGVATTFSYGGQNERIKRVTGATTSLYPFGDDYEITNGTVTKYIAGDGLGSVAKRVGSPPNVQTYWLHRDRIGSMNAITDVFGQEVQRRSYRPYGQRITDATGHTETRGWIDERTDAEAALVYLHARYYDADLGLFVSPDPLDASTSGDIPRFTYGSGDPVNMVDSTGLKPCHKDVEFDSDGNRVGESTHCTDIGTEVIANPQQVPGAPSTPQDPAGDRTGKDRRRDRPPRTTPAPAPAPAPGTPPVTRKPKKPETEEVEDPCAGYLDGGFSANFIPTKGGILGPAFGVLVGKGSTHIYGGISDGTPGASMTITRSRGSRPSPGLNLSGGGGFAAAPAFGFFGVGPAFQGGYGAVGRGGTFFGEAGLMFGMSNWGGQAVWVSEKVSGGTNPQCK